MPELSAVLLRFLYQSLLLSFSILLAALLPPFLFSQFLSACLAAMLPHTLAIAVTLEVVQDQAAATMADFRPFSFAMVSIQHSVAYLVFNTQDLPQQSYQKDSYFL